MIGYYTIGLTAVGANFESLGVLLVCSELKSPI